MVDKKRILLIHPEGNINNNPNLSGIVEILCENGYLIDILSMKREFPQISPSPGAEIIILPTTLYAFFLKIISYLTFHNTLKLVSRNIIKKIFDYTLIIGVDSDGIILSSKISEILNTPYGLISYEIFFEKETGFEFKRAERQASSKIEFAVCQDQVRANLLSQENHIPQEKFIFIPVAGRNNKAREKNWYLHDLLKIDHSKKIALFAGSIAKWTMIDELLKTTENWPADWILVVHNRYGINDEIKRYLRDYLSVDNIRISVDYFSTPNEFSKILYSVDLGIALYKPTYTSKYTGDNLKYIGLSSGKISTYLQHGIPVLSNEIGQMSGYIKTNNIGYIVEDVNEIPEILKRHNLRPFQNNCIQFFEKYLGLENTIEPLLMKINHLTK